MQSSVFLATQVVRFVEAFVLAWGLVYLADRFGRKGFLRVGWKCGRWWLGPLAVGGLAAGVTAAVSSARPPLPAVHDEFSYLLAADTFSHGRLTNRTHPMWRHFETLHVIQRPTYASKYPPAQGLVLALGQTLARDPLAGLWLSGGLAAAASTWMLLGWVPRRWSVLGGVFVALHPGIQLVWNQSFWGGSMAFIGSALVLGASVRLRHTSRCRDAMGLALGLAVLANSRPFEGLVASLPVAVAMLSWLVKTLRHSSKQESRLTWHPIKERGHRRGAIGTERRDPIDQDWRCTHLQPAPSNASVSARHRTAVFLLCAGLTISAGWMAYYNWRVTGKPWKMPYMVYEETYGAAPFFLWQPPGAIPEYRHPTIARLHDWLRKTYLYQRTWAGFVGEKWVAMVNLWHFYLGVALSFPLLALPWIVRNGRYWLPVAIVTATLGALLTTTWSNPHYFAPAGPALLLLVVQGLRHVAARVKIRQRRFLAIATAATRGGCQGGGTQTAPSCEIARSGRNSPRPRLVATLILTQVLGFVPYAWFHVSQTASAFAAQRSEVQRRLREIPGRHLVLVRYSPDCDIHQEWVENAADIDGAEVVWAREVDSQADRLLLDYFRDRHAWLLRVVRGRPWLTPLQVPPEGPP